MSALKVLCAALLILFMVLALSADQRNITAEPGGDVILPCRAPEHEPVIVTNWIRTDLESGDVLMYRDSQFDPDFQHPSFKNRLHLLGDRMKDGDASLVLQNVRMEDGGTYECWVVYRGTNQGKRPRLKTDLISTVHLEVDPPPPPPPGNLDGGNFHGRFELIPAAVLILICGILSRRIKCPPKCKMDDVY